MTILDQDGQPTGPAIRVALGIPSGDMVHMGFAFDLAQMVGATIAARQDIDIRLVSVQGTLIPKSRQDLVRMSLKGGCTHILFLDSDMRFPRNTLLRLLSHGQPIVAANYVTRRHDCQPITFRNDTDPTDRVYTEPSDTGLEPVASTGMGVMLVDLDVFRALEEPWFSLAWVEASQSYQGEDVWFCLKARELGLQILIDHDLTHEVKHIGSYEYTMADALVARDLAADAGAKASE
jgi:hypothetical protein